MRKCCSLAAIALMVVSVAVVAQVSAVTIDFDAAMRGLNFDPKTTDGNLDQTSAGNGIVDADELLLVSAILRDPKLDLRKRRGIDHASVAQAFAQAQASATTDMQSLATRYPTAATVAAGYAMLGKNSFESYSAMSTGFGAPMKSDYTLALKLNNFLAYDGDADGDGLTNRAEYLATINNGRDAYLAAALNPDIKPDVSNAKAAPAPTAVRIIGIVLYPDFEVLDVFGPVEMWGYLPGYRVVMVSEKGGAVKSAQSVSVMAEYSFANAPQLDIMMVPGGKGTRAELNNSALLDFIKKQDVKSTLTTSVCTGSALLAKAGLLKGRKATSNKNFFSLAVEQDPSVDWQRKARWVEDGKYFTSSGVSAGTDMALGVVARIVGKEHAGHLAHDLEYQWDDDAANDPFAIATPHKPRQ
jgi:putative intracellular protease/amidase